MTEMRGPTRTAVLAVTLLAAVGAVAATAPAAASTVPATASQPSVSVGPDGRPTVDAVAGRPANATAESDQPGADLAGAVGTEESTLGGELQSRTYEVRLRRAETPSERAAVLRDIGAEMDGQLATLETRRDRLASGNLSAGESAYLRETASVETRVLARLATSTRRFALGLQGVDGDLAERFATLAERSAALEAAEWAVDVELPEGIDIEGFDTPTPPDEPTPPERPTPPDEPTPPEQPTPPEDTDAPPRDPDEPTLPGNETTDQSSPLDDVPEGA